MKMEKLTGVIVRPRTGLEVVRFEPKLEWYYENLECEYIDIQERWIGGNLYDIVCDDEGLLKEEVIPSACDSTGQAVFCGNLLICHHDGEGNETGLTEEEVNELLCRHYATAPFNGETIHLLADVEYTRG